MFGTNERVGKAWFEQNRPDPNKIMLVSNFLTIQGEGPYRGRRAVFQRLAKCQLNCFMCDSYFDSGSWVDLGKLLDMALDASISDGENHDCGLVITGGEPMLQSNLGRYLETAYEMFSWTQIESNGGVWQEIPDDVCLVISPKVAEINGALGKYIKPHDRVLTRADCLKFVMSADKRSPYSEIPSWAFEWRRKTGRDIYISPMNIYTRQPVKTVQMSVEERSKVDETISWWEPGLLDMQANQANHEYAARYALKHDCVFQMQLHLFASLA